MVGFAVVGSVYLSKLTAGRYEEHDRKTRTTERATLGGKEAEEAKFDLGKEYEKTLKGVDLDSFENKRISRTKEQEEEAARILAEKRRALAEANK